MLYFVNGAPADLFDLTALRTRFPSIAWSDDPTADVLALVNVTACQPSASPTGYVVITGSYAQSTGSSYIQAWNYRPMTAAEIAATPQMKQMAANNIRALILRRAAEMRAKGNVAGALEYLRMKGQL